MKFPSRVSWGYAILLVVLFSIAAIATKQVIDFTAERFIQPDQESAVQGFSAAIWLLTMGLMFLSGALGLLAISTTAEYESRHRIARIVNAMNYLLDGLLALDYNGVIRAANPAARKLANGYTPGLKRKKISDFFPALTDDNIKLLLNRNVPAEIETEHTNPSGSRILRLRSQPADGLLLLFISDITEAHSSNLRQQQTAKLQLLGRIAGGVAHDFSNILCAISGHASLIQRLDNDKTSLDNSVEIIQSQSERGVRLSQQLLLLSRTSESVGQSSENLIDNIREAEELLRITLSSLWRVETHLEGPFPVVPLSPDQIVQIVLNLALLASDALKKPGRLIIRAKQTQSLAQDLRRFAVVIIISASAEPEDSLDKPLNDQAVTNSVIDTTGVIPSVVRTLVEEAGGKLDELYTGNMKSFYRICLPHASKLYKSFMTPLNSVIKGPLSLKRWKILLASADNSLLAHSEVLKDSGALVDKESSIEAVLGKIDSKQKPDVIIVDKHIFGNNADGLLKAVRKISANSGIVILSKRPQEESLRNERGFIFIESSSGKDVLLDAIVRSKQVLSS